jgi:hypothetical protein
MATGVLALFAAAPLQAETYYVAPTPTGNDGNDGSEGAPFASLDRAQEAATAGDTVLIRGGEYVFSGTGSDIGVLFDTSGEEGAPINYWAYPGERPIFDFFDLTPQARIRGFSVRASWLHFRGLELRGVQQTLVNENESWCIRVENGASNNIFELLDLHHNEGPGLFIQDGGNNLVLNVDSHHNYDPDRGGENSDGFGCHSNDAGNVFRGCRAWYNSDDGYDFINAPGACTLEYSWAFNNGYIPDTNNAVGNGSGIKAGGFGSPATNVPNPVPRHLIRFNVSFNNLATGFYSNHHPGGLDWFHNTAFNNPRNFDMLADEGAADHYLRNNLAAGSGTALAQATQDEIDDEFNSWSLPVDVSDADFLSTAADEATMPRQADGSLPNVSFLKLVEGSDLIDAGTDVGLYFVGDAPDLGAFEFGAMAPGAGGVGGAGGSGAGGAGVGGAGVGGGSGGTAGTSGLGGSAGSSSGAGGASTGTTAAGVGGAASGAVSAAVGSGAGGAGGGAVGSGGTGAGNGNGTEDAGCACRAAGARTSGFPSVFALLVAAAACRRRRARRAVSE